MPPRLPCTCTAQSALCLGCLAYAASQGDDGTRRCVVCAAPLTTRFRWCEPCKEAHQAGPRSVYLARKAAGQCVVCLAVTSPGRAYCARCAARRRRDWPAISQQRMQRLAAAKQHGVCPTPGCQVAVQGTVYCATCRAKNTHDVAARKARRRGA